MEERALLHRIDYKKGTILLDGKEYPLKDDRFPTIDPAAPYELTEEEEEIMERLEKAFAGCELSLIHICILEHSAQGMSTICWPGENRFRRQAPL